MCNYSFPDGVNVSKTMKQFISKMLQRDPARRSTVDEILSDELFNTPFPKSLPVCTLACPPNSNFIKQFKESTDNIEKLTKHFSES